MASPASNLSSISKKGWTQWDAHLLFTCVFHFFFIAFIIRFATFGGFRFLIRTSNPWLCPVLPHLSDEPPRAARTRLCPALPHHSDGPP